MAIVKHFLKKYSDAMLVRGVYEHSSDKEEAFYTNLKDYYNSHYLGLFQVNKEVAEEIFYRSMKTILESIRSQKIYEKEGELIGVNGLPFKGSLYTYFMGISRNKFREWQREEEKYNCSFDNPDNCKCDTIGETDEESAYLLKYGDTELIKFQLIAECITHMSERCNQIITSFYYKGMSLDDIMKEQKTIKSKDTMKSAKYKCLKNLRIAANHEYNKRFNHS